MNWPRPARTARVRGKPEVMVQRSRCICVWAFTFCLLFLAGRAAAQEKGDWFHIGTGLGVEKPRVAVTDFAPRGDTAKSHSQLFTQVPTIPSELRNADWTTPQINANLIAFGNLTESASEVVISAWLYDVRSPSTQAVVGKIYRGTPTDAQVRKFAHEFADEIISRLSGGLPGIASTQIAFVSSRTGTK